MGVGFWNVRDEEEVVLVLRLLHQDWRCRDFTLRHDVWLSLLFCWDQCIYMGTFTFVLSKTQRSSQQELDSFSELEKTELLLSFND